MSSSNILVKLFSILRHFLITFFYSFCVIQKCFQELASFYFVLSHVALPFQKNRKQFWDLFPNQGDNTAPTSSDDLSIGFRNVPDVRILWCAYFCCGLTFNCQK